MFGNLGFGEILLILVVVLLLFGAKRLPEVGSSIGKGIREFKRSISDTQDAIMGSEEQHKSVPPHPMSSLPPNAQTRFAPMSRIARPIPNCGALRSDRSRMKAR